MRKALMAGFACWSLLAVAGAQSAQGGGQSTSSQAASSREVHSRETASGQASGKSAQQPAGNHKDGWNTAANSGKSGNVSGADVNKDGMAAPAGSKASSPRDAQSGMATGKVAPMKISSSQPSITENKKTVSASGNSQTRVAVGDVNGDGKADVALQHDVKSPRDSSTGMATGKTTAMDDWHANAAVSASQAAPVRESPSKASQGTTLRESPSKASQGKPSVSAADVDGDGKADVAATAGSGNGAQNAAVNTSHSNIKNTREASSGKATGKSQPVAGQKDSAKN